MNSAQDPQLKTRMFVLSQNLAIPNHSEVKGRVPRIFVGVVVVYLFCVWVFGLYLCVTYMPSSFEGQKISNPQELELQTFVSYAMGAEN